MNILITGKNSYIGACTKAYLERFGHHVDEADTMTDEWQHVPYASYDAVLHVAAIVHENAKTASKDLFHAVNVELPVRIATLAKENGVKQFVFLSTMAVYGVDKSLSQKDCLITADTSCAPTSLYGKTKWEAEQQLTPLANETFTVSVVRPPNVYGAGCKGNYMGLLQKAATLMFFCPKAFTDVRQSMLYIDNLAEAVRLIVEERAGGVFLPQDDVAPNTVELIESIRRIHGKKTAKSALLGALVSLFKSTSVVGKMYGGVCYDFDSCRCLDDRYRVVSFEKGLELTYKQ